jgi:DNA mismatch repair protein MutS
MIITGPNMAGKSTVMRQAALTIIMAQIGSFVPADTCEIGIVDRVFTRIGASDFISRGMSTFMVEMCETAKILNLATNKSFIILDEVGRGTSTFDGMSIAYAICEYIHDKIGARTMFATHYHELTDIAKTKERIKNYNILVKEYNEEIIFLRKLVAGHVNRSFGIEVARLAGVREEVIARAKEILSNLEKIELDEIGEPKFAKTKIDINQKRQMSISFDLNEKEKTLLKSIRDLNLDILTPIEALNKLFELKKQL